MDWYYLIYIPETDNLHRKPITESGGLMSVPSRIIELVELFERNIASYKSGNYNETQVRLEFINPFFEGLAGMLKIIPVMPKLIKM